MYKKCTKCKKNKELKCFSNDIRTKDSKQYHCKDCITINAKKYYAKITGRTEEQVRKNNRHEYSGKIVNGMKTCSECNQWKTIDNFPKSITSICGLASSCKECFSYRLIMIDRMLKMEFVLAYGGKCQCEGCGEKRIEFLTIEHIRNNGHKLIYGYTSTGLIRKLKKLGWPDGYTVLCYGCNQVTKDDKPCPHTKEYKDYITQLELSIKSDIIRNKYFELKQQLIM